MKTPNNSSKLNQVSSWIKNFSKSGSNFLVSNYCYDCLFTGNLMTKTLIVFPDELQTKGIITIDKPLEKIELIDVINIYSKINKA